MKILKKTPLLIIKEIEGNMSKGVTIVINPTGLVNSVRNKKDGVTFFGNKLKRNDSIINDFCLVMDNEESNHDQLFFIYYKRESNKYYIRAIKESKIQSFPMVLARIDRDFCFKIKQIIKIDCFYFQLIPYWDKIVIVKIDTRDIDSIKKRENDF